MLPKNFPGRVKARRVGALERLLQSTVYVDGKLMRVCELPHAGANSRPVAVYTLQERIEANAPARRANGKGKRDRSGKGRRKVEVA